MRRWRRFNTDLPGLLDEWAASLFRELDYRHEAANGVRFRELYGHMEVGCWGSVAGLARRESWHEVAGRVEASPWTTGEEGHMPQ